MPPPPKHAKTTHANNKNAAVSNITHHILSLISRFHTLHISDKEQLYALFENASADDITRIYEADGIQTLAQVLKQKNAKYTFTSSNTYIAAEILAVFFSRNTSYRAIMRNHLLQANVDHPKKHAIKFLRHLQYDAVIQATFHKTMHTLLHSDSTIK